jgi:cytochrome c peroxidase
MAVAHRVLQAIGAGLCLLGGLLIATYAMTGASLAQTAPPPSTGLPLGSLKSISVQSPDLSAYVQDKTALVQLGKALFWDQQVGSDGVQACATCHFQAGADVRTKNTLSPAVLDGTTTWQIGGPNYQVKASDYPFHKLTDISNAASPVVSDTNTVTGSEGVFDNTFNLPGLRNKGADMCTQVADPTFNVGGINVRRVTGRNAPSAINAVFNFRNFWDGRAQFTFNGVNPFGERDPNHPTLYKNVNGKVDQNGVQVAIPYSSLASQAVGPPGSAFEMSCDGRIFPNIGRKMLTLTPLDQQQVAADDSVLGPLAAGGHGLRTSYVDLIKKAFRPEWWASTDLIPIGAATPVTKSYLNSDLVKILGKDNVKRLRDGDEKKVIIPNNLYLQMEANFSLFFGLAIQSYETSLVSNDSPVDQYFDGNTSALTPQQLNGMAIFMGPGKCMNCHGGPETTNASVRNVSNERLERMTMGHGGVAVYDDGFYNIGARPTADDAGVGGNDPFGNPLSESALCQLKMKTAGQSCASDVLNVPANVTENIAAATLDPNERIAVQGSFKAPQLRNVELTGPYFHNGSKATLRQVVDFYARGGDFPANPDLDVDIAPIMVPSPDGLTTHRMTDSEKDDLVSFLVALTDARVKYEKAPFDHPQLCLPNGEEGSTTSVTRNGSSSMQAKDSMQCLPATGKGGHATPLKPFLGLDPHSGSSPSTSTTPSPTPVAGGAGGGVVAPAPVPPNTPPLTTGSVLMASGGRTPTGGLRMGTHTWVADEVLGLCRLDPNAAGTLDINMSTCIDVAIPGQPAFDPTTNTLYVADKSSNSVGTIWRLLFDPVSETIPMPNLSAFNPASGAAGPIATVGTQRPFAVALGPDHQLYVSQLKSPNIVRIDLTVATPTVTTIAQTSDGQGVQGMAFVGNDLYLGQSVALAKVANATTCSGACVASVTPMLVAAPSAVAADASGALYVADTPVDPGPSVLRRFNPNTATQDVVATAGTQTDGTSTPFFSIAALWLDPSLGGMIVGDMGGLNGPGRLWKVVPPA